MDRTKMELEISMNNFQDLMEAVLPIKIGAPGESFGILGNIVDTAKNLTMEFQNIKGNGLGQIEPEKWDKYEQELHGYINKLLELKELDAGSIFKIKIKMDRVLQCTAPIRDAGFGSK